MQANPTLDQLSVFVAVVDAGSFSGAARSLNRAQSVISYAIANLENQLDLKLFDRAGTREPTLTDAGRAMLPDARRMIAMLDEVRARALGLNMGLEAELAVAVDVATPSPVLINVLTAFEVEFPTVLLRLIVGALGVVWGQLESGNADVSFGGQPVNLPASLTGTRIGDASMTPVSAPGHPLAQYEGRVPLQVVREHKQLVVSDVSNMTAGQDFGVFGYRTWRMTDMNTKYRLILAGLGWGGLPSWMVHEDVSAGRLVQLNLEPYPMRQYPIYAFHRADRPPGPAASWMIEQFRHELAQLCARYSAVG